MQSEVIKYQPPVEGVVVTQEEEQQILKLGRIMREQLDQSHKDVRLFGRLSTVMAFLLGDGISGAVFDGRRNHSTVRGDKMYESEIEA